MTVDKTEREEKGNFPQRILFEFQLHIDDLSAKPRHPVICRFILVFLSLYYLSSILLLFSNDGAWISATLNLLCVYKGFLKVYFNRQIYREDVHKIWNNCTAEHEMFLKSVCNPYARMYFLELLTVIVLTPALLIIALFPAHECFAKVLGTIALLIAFVGDSVDVLSDMYCAYPPMPPPTAKKPSQN